VVTPAEPASRRRLLEISIAAGAAVALAGCGTVREQHVAESVQDRDATLLNGLLMLERRAIAAYTASIPLLAGADKRAATDFLRQELDHSGTLIALIKTVDGTPTPRVASYPLGEPGSRRALLTLLHDLERAQIAGYAAAIGELSPGSVRQWAATILADHAQHISILRAALGLPPTPAAFVTGKE
jgi:hypothetical protein